MQIGEWLCVFCSLEDSCGLRVKEEQEKFKQMEEQYEDQVAVLREQLADCVPREEVEPLLNDAHRYASRLYISTRQSLRDGIVEFFLLSNMNWDLCCIEYLVDDLEI